MKEFKIRFSVDVPEATSEAVAGWLDEALTTDVSLVGDPGGGELFVNLSLDEAKVAELANRHGCKSNVALRRLIASRVSLSVAEPPKRKSAGALMAEVLPGKVLPKKLEYKEADLLPVVRGLDHGMVLLYREIYGLPDLAAARTPEADRELASAMAECVNRRAPDWLVANGDLVKLTISGVRWSLAQTDELERQVREARKKAKEKTKSPVVKVPGVSSSEMTVEEFNQAVAATVAGAEQVE